jgi:hypothetical protein
LSLTAPPVSSHVAMLGVLDDWRASAYNIWVIREFDRQEKTKF